MINGIGELAVRYSYVWSVESMDQNMEYLLYVMDTKAFESDEKFERRLGMVSEYRRSKVMRLRRREDRNASLAAGCLLSYALRRYAGIDERQAAYIKNKAGKPSIIENYDEQYGLGRDVPGVDRMCVSAYRNDNTDIQFSISHTEGCVAVVVGRHTCGIDVEHVRRIPDSIVNRMYSSKDADRIFQIEKNGERADEYSTCVWTRREAYGKMTGRGLLMSDPDQMMVMDDGHMEDLRAVLMNYRIGRYPSEGLCIINEGASAKTQFIVAVCLAADTTIPDLQVVDSYKLEI